MPLTSFSILKQGILQKNLSLALILNCRSYSVKYNIRKLKKSMEKESFDRLPNEHCYANLFPYKKKETFVDKIYENIVYNKDGLIAINKPHGVPIYEPNYKPGKTVTQTAGIIQQDAPYCLEQALPGLQEKLQIDCLKILRSSERYFSGIVLLASKEIVQEKVLKAFHRAKAQNIPHLVHWIITYGFPNVESCKEKIGIKLINIGYQDEKQAVIVQEYSHNSVLRQEVKTATVDYCTLNTNKDLSICLLKMATNSVKWHLIQVYITSRGCSVLGDHIYGVRVKQILRSPININPQNLASCNIEPLPKEICKKLLIPSGSTGHAFVPQMIHLHSVILPGYLHKNKDLIISADPPSQFQWTYEQLNLTPENDNVQKINVSAY